MLQPSAIERAAAITVFGSRTNLAHRFVEHLATSGIERGLLGPREIPRIWGRHVLNCAVVADLIAPGMRVADVGSGAGLPGLTFAIARPDLELTLIEPLERRVTWLKEVIEDLGLDNVAVLRARAEQAVDVVNPQIVTARAVSELGKLAQLTIPLLKGNGLVLAIKGRSAVSEVDKAGSVIRKLGGVETSILSAGSNVLTEPTTVVRIAVGPENK